MKFINLVRLIAFLPLAGCAGQYWSNGERGAKTGAGVITWDTNHSAALVIPNDNKPRACTQLALATDSETKKVQVNVSNSLLSVMSKVPNNATPSDLAAITADLTRISQTLNTSTEKTTYLQVGGFYVCQLQANGLSEQNVVSLMNALITASSIK